MLMQCRKDFFAMKRLCGGAASEFPFVCFLQGSRVSIPKRERQQCFRTLMGRNALLRFYSRLTEGKRCKPNCTYFLLHQKLLRLVFIRISATSVIVRKSSSERPVQCSVNSLQSFGSPYLTGTVKSLQLFSQSFATTKLTCGRFSEVVLCAENEPLVSALRPNIHIRLC